MNNISMPRPTVSSKVLDESKPVLAKKSTSKAVTDKPRKTKVIPTMELKRFNYMTYISHLVLKYLFEDKDDEGYILDVHRNRIEDYKFEEDDNGAYYNGDYNKIAYNKLPTYNKLTTDILDEVLTEYPKYAETNQLTFKEKYDMVWTICYKWIKDYPLIEKVLSPNKDLELFKINKDDEQLIGNSALTVREFIDTSEYNTIGSRTKAAISKLPTDIAVSVLTDTNEFFNKYIYGNEYMSLVRQFVEGNRFAVFEWTDISYNEDVCGVGIVRVENEEPKWVAKYSDNMHEEGLIRYIYFNRSEYVYTEHLSEILENTYVMITESKSPYETARIAEQDVELLKKNGGKGSVSYSKINNNYFKTVDAKKIKKFN